MDKIILEIKEALEKQGVSETKAAELAGLDQNKVNRMLRGVTKRLDHHAVGELQKVLGLKNDDSCQIVDIYNMVSAGPGAVPEWDEPVDRRSIPANLVKKGTRAVLVRGRSMEPAIRNGAIIGVDLSDKRVVEGEVYAVLLPLHGAAVKRLYLKKDSVLIRSDNKEFPEQEYAQGEIGDNFILGRVKWVVQEL
jgi:phage repressor protein C with HTH and peptisase S24 domain